MSGSGKCCDPARDWLLDLSENGNSSRQPIATFDDLQGLYRAVSGGLGIGALPHFTLPEAAGMTRVLPDFISPEVDGYFLYPAELRNSKRIAVFRDFLLREIARTQLNLDPWRDALANPSNDRAIRPSLLREIPAS